MKDDVHCTALHIVQDDVKDDVEGGMRSLAGSGTGCSSLTA